MSRRSLFPLLASGAFVPLARRLRAGDGQPEPDVYVPRLSGHAPGNFGLAITPDGTTAYVSFSLDDALLEVDLQAWTIRAGIDVGPAGTMLNSNQLCLSSDARWLLVANHGTQNLLVVNTQARRVETVLPVFPSHSDCLRATSDGQGFLIAGRDGFLYLLSLRDLGYRRLARPPAMPLSKSVEVSPVSADTVYCAGERRSAGYNDQALAVYRLSDESVQGILPLPAEVWSPGWRLRMRCSAVAPRLYLGTMHGGDRGEGGLSLIDLGKPEIVCTTEVENGVSDFVLCEDLGKVYAIGFWSGGGAPNELPLIEWDIASRTISRRIPLSQASDLRAIVRHPQRPRSVLMTEGDRDELREVNTADGLRSARVSFTRSELAPRSFIPAGARTYVVGQKDRFVRVFDWETFSLRAAFPLPGDLRNAAGGAYRDGVLYFVQGDRAYAVGAASGSLMQTFRLETQVITSGLSLTPGRLVCIDYLSGGMVGRRMLVFHLSDFRLARQVPLPAEPHGDKVIVSPDGTKAYVPSGLMSGPAKVSIFDTASWEIRRVLEIPPIGSPPSGASSFSDADFDERRRIVYLLGFGSVFRIHMDTDELLGNDSLRDVLQSMGRESGWSPSGLAGAVLSADRERLFVASGDAHCLYAFDCRANRWQRRILNLRGYFITDACASPDRRYLLTANLLSDSLTLVDTASGQVVGLYDLQAERQARLLPFNLVNAASLQSGPVCPGEIVSLFGLRFGPEEPVGARVGTGGRLETRFGEVRVLFNGVPAPLLYAGGNQINAVVPFGTGSHERCRVWVETPDGLTNAIEVAVAPTAPALFTLDGSGGGQAAVQNADGSLSGPDHPARRGSVVTLWGTGQGETVPPGVDGAIAGSPARLPIQRITVDVGGQPAEVLYAGDAPGMVSALLQINVRIPASAPTGASIPLGVSAGNARSPSGVTIAIA